MERLEGVHPLLVDWAFRVVSIMDCKVIYGVRTLTEQRHMVSINASRTMNSRHLVNPDTGYGEAVDLAPYPIDWQDLNRFWLLGGVGLAVAHEMGIPITWGRDWDGDMDFGDQDFQDYLHWQLPRGQGFNVVEV
jgi:peptidoglycan L-alanyl-D-glutamate endopeptidase CwlK